MCEYQTSNTILTRDSIIRLYERERGGRGRGREKGEREIYCDSITRYNDNDQFNPFFTTLEYIWASLFHLYNIIIFE